MRIHMPNLHHEDKATHPESSGSGYRPIYLMPPPPAAWPAPKLRLEATDLKHPGAVLFFKHVNPADDLGLAVESVLKTLYTLQTCTQHVRSVTLYLENMGGVAYTKGSELDDDHKEIHLSMQHIENSKQRAKDETLGVIVHEMVHCFQYNAKGSCPGGLIEGIADYVRLKAGFSPPHWKRGGSRWDEGYQTTGYFLEWIENTFGQDFVRRLNGSMRDKKYNEGIFKEFTGKAVDELWKMYKAFLQQ